MSFQFRLGVAYMASGQWRCAIQALAKGVKLDPDSLAMVSHGHAEHSSVHACPAVSKPCIPGLSLV